MSVLILSATRQVLLVSSASIRTLIVWRYANMLQVLPICLQNRDDSALHWRALRQKNLLLRITSEAIHGRRATKTVPTSDSCLYPGVCKMIGT